MCQTDWTDLELQIIRYDRCFRNFDACKMRRLCMNLTIVIIAAN